MAEAPNPSRNLVFRLADGSRWLNWLSYDEAQERGTITWLAAHQTGRLQDPDPSLWPLVHGPLYVEGWERSQVFLRPSAIVAFEVLHS